MLTHHVEGIGKGGYRFGGPSGGARGKGTRMPQFKMDPFVKIVDEAILIGI